MSTKTTKTTTTRRDFLKYLGLGTLSLMFANLFGAFNFVTSSTPSKVQTSTKSKGGYGSTGYGA
jgi:hypothetical protein